MIDFNLDIGSPIKNNDIDLLLQQIDLLFDTNQKEVLGHDGFGTKYDEYLYKLNISNESLKQEVLSDLHSLTLFGYNPEVNVYLMQGTEQDIALIDIVLTRNEETYQRIYKIS